MPFVRASAASQYTPPASVQAARADTAAPRTDEASPFALLVDAATTSAPKAPEKAADQKSADNRSDNQPEADTADRTVAAATQKSSTRNSGTQNSGTQNSSAPAQTASAKSQPAGNNQQEDTAQTPGNQAPADQDAAPASDLPQTIDPATLPAQPPAPPASQMTQAANDDAAPADSTITGEDAVALWPQSTRVHQGAPQAAPAKPGQTDKTDKDSKKDAADAGAEPDAGAALAAHTPPPDQQPATAAGGLVPPPPADPTAQIQGQDQLQTSTAAPAIQPADQPVAPGALDPAMLQAAPAGQQPAAGPTDQTANQTTGQAVPPPAAGPVKAATPDTAQTAQTQVAANQAPQDPGPAKDQPQQGAIQPGAPQPGAKAEASKPAKTSGETRQDSDPATVKSADSAPAQTDPVRQPEAPKAAAPDTGFKAADNAITPAGAPAPQTSGASITQHIQVSAQPRETTPNLPALAVEIAGKSQSGAKQFDIRIDPPELGRVEVRLSIDATGKASAHLSADQPQTLTLLQKDAHILTRALRDAGLDVSQDGLNFSLRQQQDNGAGAQSGQSGGRSGRGFALTATTSLEATASSAAYSGPADGHLDIRV